MDSVCCRSAYDGVGEHSDMGRCIPSVSLESDSLVILSCIGCRIRFYATRKKKKQAEVFRSMKTIIREDDGWIGR